MIELLFLLRNLHYNIVLTFLLSSGSRSTLIRAAIPDEVIKARIIVNMPSPVSDGEGVRGWNPL